MKIDIKLEISIDGHVATQNNSKVGFNMKQTSAIFAAKSLIQAANYILYQAMLPEIDQDIDYGEETID